MNKILNIILSSSFALSLLSFAGLFKENKEDEQCWNGLKAVPSSYRYSTSDIKEEPKNSNVYPLNFKYMGLGGNDAETSSIWYDYRGETVNDEPITVAVIDSGLDIYHEDFLTKEASGVKLSESNIDSYSIIDPKSCYIYDTSEGYYSSSVRTQVGIKYVYDDDIYDSEYNEYYSHGTASAACIGAAVNGVGGYGIAPKVNLLIIKMDFYFTSLDKAIRYAADNGAKVINMSLGAYAENFTDGYGDKQEGDASTATALSSAISYANNKDVVVVAAAGNEKTSHYSYPACNDGVVGVGALERASGTSSSDFSNFNKTSDKENGNNNVDVMAPGYVYTANVPQKAARTSSSSAVADSYYCETQGTSFASPLTAGAVALYRGKYPNKTRNEVMDALYKSCTDLGSTGWDYKFGYGRVNIENFLDDGIPVEEVKISPENITLNIDSNGNAETVQLNASFSPSDASEEYKEGLWISNDENIAIVDENTGLVTANGKGTTQVGFLTEKGNIEGYATIIVNDARPKIVSLSLENVPNKVSFYGDLDTSSIKANVVYEDGLTRSVANVKYELVGDTKTIGYKKVIGTYSENNVTVTSSFFVFVTNENAIRKEITLPSSSNNYTGFTSSNVFKKSGDSITLSDSSNSKNITWTIDTDATYFGYDSQSKAAQIGSKNNPASYIKLTSKESFDNVNEIKVNSRVGSKGSASFSIKVGNANLLCNGSSSSSLSTSMNEYSFVGLSSGNIEISYKITSGAIFVKDVTISIEGKTDYEWDGTDQAKSFISYLKTFVGSCYPSFEDKREEVVRLINEYNLLIDEAKKDSSFVELFDDNGYMVTPLEKLKMMVDQYNKSLKENENPLSLELIDGTFNGENNDVIGRLNSSSGKTIFILVAVSILLSISILLFFCFRKRKN